MCSNTYRLYVPLMNILRFPSVVLAGLVLIIAAGCDTSEPGPDLDSLEGYISQAPLPLSDQLIACAGGGAEDDMLRPDAPISVYFYPIEGASNFRYFETPSINVDPDDLDAYVEVTLEDAPFFNGYLWRFLNVPLDEERWARVVFETGDSLHVSNAIRLKYPVKPTLYDDTQITIAPNGVTPSFFWDSVNDATDAIYFQVVSDRNGNLISGTYTFEKTFAFYDLSNVVLNIRDVSPAPELDINSEYTFTLMTVSRDNWVNLVAQRAFTTQ